LARDALLLKHCSYILFVLRARRTRLVESGTRLCWPEVLKACCCCCPWLLLLLLLFRPGSPTVHCSTIQLPCILKQCLCGGCHAAGLYGRLISPTLPGI
jgi:hypothetical protein